MPNIQPELPKVFGSVPTDLEERMRSRLYEPHDPVNPPHGSRQPASVLAIVARLPEPQFLFILRPDNMRRHAGQVAFPGGRVEEGEDSLTGALRETQEEVGIAAAPLEVLGWLPPMATVGSNYWVTTWYAVIPEPPALVLQPEEVKEAFWVPIRQFMETDRHQVSMLPRGIPGEGRTAVDFWDVDTAQGQRLVWGVTGAMLRTFLKTVLDIELPLPLPKA